MDFLLFDDFDNIFNKLTNSFTRPVKDQQPFSVYSDAKGYIVVCNTLGIDKGDITVNLNKEKGSPYPVLSIKGESKIEKINFSNIVNLSIRLRILETVESLSFETKNGLTLIYLKVKHEQTKTLNAKYIDRENGEDLDW